MRLSAVAPFLFLLVASPAVAHVPEIDPGDHVIRDPARSYAFYDELPPGGEHVWRFALSEGDALFLHVAVPLDAAWRPQVELQAPDGRDVPLAALDRIGYEFATPYAARDVWTLDTEAPATGEYVLVVSGDGGPYALGYGLRESFTPLEWAGIPIQAIRIHLWEGQSPWILALPHALGVAVGAWGARRAAQPRGVLARFAAGLFLGSALATSFQMARALWVGATAPAWAWAFTSIAIALPLLLAWGAWRARGRLALATLGAVGLVAWAGLLVGPALAFVAALLPASLRAARPGGTRSGWAGRSSR